MALFESKPKETKEEKQERKARALMAKYGLERLPDEYREMVKSINTELAGTALMETGAILSGAKAEEQLKIKYLNVLMQQNWILMRQLDDIAALLEK